MGSGGSTGTRRSGTSVKITTILVVSAAIALTPAEVPDPSGWTTYKLADGPFQFRFPTELLELTEWDGVVTLCHAVPFEYEYSPHASEAVYRSNWFVDFRLKLWFESRELESVITKQYGSPRSWIHGNDFVEDSGFVERVQFGDLEGHLVAIGAHCGGQRTYYMRFGNGHVIAERPFCYAWEDCDHLCLEKLMAVPGIITEEMGDSLFERIMESITRAEE